MKSASGEALMIAMLKSRDTNAQREATPSFCNTPAKQELWLSGYRDATDRFCDLLRAEIRRLDRKEA